MRADKMQNSLNDFLDKAVKEVAEAVEEDIFNNAATRIENKLVETFGFTPQVITIKAPNKDNITLKGVFHEQFDNALAIVNADIPLYLVGPAGTGKNVICKQIAEALGLEFYFSNAITQEYKLTGFIDSVGKYQETQFYKAFTNGGLFFLDEIDASIPEVLVILNAAIANRYFDFPNGKVEAHKDFRVIAAGNTTGTGADLKYTGRYTLDQASLDRFAMLEIDYSPMIELSMARNDKQLCEFAHFFRQAATDSDINCLFTYRSISRIAALQDIIDDLYNILEMSLFKGLTTDDLKIITKKIESYIGRKEMNHNKYLKVFVENFLPRDNDKSNVIPGDPEKFTVSWDSLNSSAVPKPMQWTTYTAPSSNGSFQF